MVRNKGPHFVGHLTPQCAAITSRKKTVLWILKLMGNILGMCFVFGVPSVRSDGFKPDIFRNDLLNQTLHSKGE